MKTFTEENYRDYILNLDNSTIINTTSVNLDSLVGSEMTVIFDGRHYSTQEIVDMLKREQQSKEKIEKLHALVDINRKMSKKINEKNNAEILNLKNIIENARIGLKYENT